MNREFYFATKAIIVRDEKFLALYKHIDDEKLWDLPGGRMEFGETPEQTLHREIFEELCIEVKPVKLIDTWNYVFENTYHVTGVIYYCEANTDDIKLSNEHDGYEWVSFKDVGRVFTAQTFVSRMRHWDWESVIDSSLKCVNCSE